jgi:cytochrome c
LIALTAALLSSPPAVASGPDGAAIYKQRCAGCHGASGAPSTVAPSLVGVVGRKAASTHFNYSDALKACGLTWTRPNLDKFLSGPMKMVPGTQMVVSIPDPAQRAAVIDYLASTGR